MHRGVHGSNYSATGRRRVPRCGGFTWLVVLSITCFSLSALYSGRANAALQEYETCLRLQVTLTDELDPVGDDDDDDDSYPNELGHSGNWKARGLKISSMKLNGTPLSGFPKYADPSTGCFTVEVDISDRTQYDLKIVSRGIVQDDNEIIVSGDDGTPGTYTKTLILDPLDPDQVFVWPNESNYLRTYAIIAYSINGFRGTYDDELLHVWWYPNGEFGDEQVDCDLISSHFTAGGETNICTDLDDSAKKYVLAHEYGHCNLDLAIATYELFKDCTWPDVQSFTTTGGDGGSGGTTLAEDHYHGHSMVGGYPEWNSCAANEGWASFVAADVFTDNAHSGGDPGASIKYWKGGLDIVDLDDGHGACAGEYLTNLAQFRSQYADVCFSDSLTWDNASSCSGGDCEHVAAEVDYLRLFWDFHTDTSNYSGGTVNHDTLHLDLRDANNLDWRHDTFWETYEDAVCSNSTPRCTRLNDIADDEGVSEP